MRKGLVKRPEDRQWSSYNRFALGKAPVAACPIQIDDVRLPLGYRAGWRRPLYFGVCDFPKGLVGAAKSSDE